MSFTEGAKGCGSVEDLDASVWPDMWTMTSDDPDDPQAMNKQDNVDPTVLASAGVKYWNFDPSVYPYPNVSVPWEPTDTGNLDPQLVKFRDDNGYTYADIITVSSIVPSFWDEHLHADATIRYILNGSGYFDLRAADDSWVRMHVQAGDMMEWPAGIFHRFTVDDNNFITAMRLFQGSPIWTSYPRAEDSYLQNETAVESRKAYEDMYLNCESEQGGAEPSVDETNEGSSASLFTGRLSLVAAFAMMYLS